MPNPLDGCIAGCSMQDPVFDLLLSTMFGDVIDFERRVLDPSAEVLERAKAVGQKIAEVCVCHSCMRQAAARQG